MSNGRRCRRSAHRRDQPVGGSQLDVCDGCGEVVDPDDVAVMVWWADGPEGPVPVEAFVGHRCCADVLVAHTEEAHPEIPVHLDEDESWLRRAMGL